MLCLCQDPGYGIVDALYSSVRGRPEHRRRQPASAPGAIAATLLWVMTAGGMTACSKDIPTEPDDKPGTGGARQDVTIQTVPVNDEITSARAISAIPFADTINTTEATTNPDDPFCLSNEQTVWYTFTPSENIQLNANTFGSDYDTGLSLFTGAPGALTPIDCNDDAGGTLQSSLTFDAQAGTTYFFLVESYPGTGGGNLIFNLREAPPALELGLTIDPLGTVDARTGVATVGGTVTCSQPVPLDLFGDLSQRLGRSISGAFFDIGVQCDGQTTWRADVPPENGLFVAGRVAVTAVANAEDPMTGEIVEARAAATVRLKGR